MMRLHPTTAGIAIMLVGCALPLAAVAQERPANAARIVDDVVACKQIVAAAERLTCYDRNVDRLASARTANDLVVVDREQVRKTKRSLFGFSLPNLNLFGRDDKDEAEPIKQIDTTIASFRQVAYGRWQLTLADGAVWETTAALQFPPRAGDKIRIKPGLMGAYNASVDSGRIVSIKRVR